MAAEDFKGFEKKGESLTFLSRQNFKILDPLFLLFILKAPTQKGLVPFFKLRHSLQLQILASNKPDRRNESFFLEEQEN